MQENNIEAAKIELCKAWVYALYKQEYGRYSNLISHTLDVSHEINEALKITNPNNLVNSTNIDVKLLDTILDIIAKKRVENFNDTLADIISYVGTCDGSGNTHDSLIEPLRKVKYKFGYLKSTPLDHNESFKCVLGIGIPIELILEFEGDDDVEYQLEFLDKWKDNIFVVEGYYDSWRGVIFEQDCFKRAVPKIVKSIEF